VISFVGGILLFRFERLVFDAFRKSDIPDMYAQ
jgi:hypothetical protein